jgi:hypothetical protein
MNPDPLTVRVTELDPAITLAGLIDAIAGVGGGLPLPEPEEDEPPPQLVRPTDKVAPRQHRTKNREDCMSNSMASFPNHASFISRLFIASRFGVVVGMAPRGETWLDTCPGSWKSGLRARAYF